MEIRYLLHRTQLLRGKSQNLDTEFSIILFIHVEDIFLKPLVALKGVSAPDFFAGKRIFLSSLIRVLSIPFYKFVLAIFT